LPPGTPKGVVKTMQRAFQRTMQDSQFTAEMKQAKLGLDPVEPEEIVRIVGGMSKLDSNLAAKLRDILGIKK
jgi:tripartite-type tricarboxylate transporter receptor subunit TctC